MKRIPGCLRSAAPGNEDLSALAQLIGWPYQVELSLTTIGVLIEIAVFIQRSERRRIWHPFIESLDIFGGASRQVIGLLFAGHFDFVSGVVPLAPPESHQLPKL